MQVIITVSFLYGNCTIAHLIMFSFDFDLRFNVRYAFSIHWHIFIHTDLSMDIISFWIDSEVIDLVISLMICDIHLNHLLSHIDFAIWWISVVQWDNLSVNNYKCVTFWLGWHVHWASSN